MRRPRPFEPEGGLRLFSRRTEDRTEWWTWTVGSPPAVYGERWASSGGRTYRAWDPSRSKLAAGLSRGWDGPMPSPGSTWLYLGAASGTTASHVADLVGPAGAVLAVEKSVRPFARLLDVAERWPNLLPVLGDAREPDRYSDLVPPVDGIYADVSQPDQVGIVLAHADRFLVSGAGAIVVALKTPSLGRGRAPPAHLERAEEQLSERVTLAPSVRLEPFHRGHYLIGGEPGGSGRVARPGSRSDPASAPRRRGWGDGPRRPRARPPERRRR